LVYIFQDEIKHIVSETCDKLPNAIVGQCHNFVELYGDAIIALLIQETDPTQVSE
jgi:saposin